MMTTSHVEVLPTPRQSEGREVVALAEGPAWDLVRATQPGDKAAFGQLFDRYHEMVFGYVLFRVGDRHLAEDLTAETFFRALRRISSVSYQGRDIGAWFVAIARNLIIDHLKSARFRRETTSEIADFSPSRTGPEQEAGPEQQVLDAETHEVLLRCVARLNDVQRECIELRFLKGLSGRPGRAPDGTQGRCGQGTAAPGRPQARSAHARGVAISTPTAERGPARQFVDPIDLMCPGCCGSVRPVAPGYWVAAYGMPAPQWSHRDGSSLCWPSDGTVAQPVRRERRNSGGPR
jgi:RNA polymerase sigma-70 factor (ECF subfamily)